MKLPRAVRRLAVKALSSLVGGWRRIIWDTYAGQWQQDVEVDTESVLTFSPVFACIRLIATDIGKLRMKLMERSASGIWSEFDSPAFSPVLRKPNPYQTRIKFLEQWVTSKLIRGNAYMLKSRDARGVVKELRVLDPLLVTPLVSESGAVFYQLSTDRMVGIIDGDVIVPAREIIHDVHIAIDHPLVGVSPIGACGLAATQGLKIQTNSAKFFSNMSRAGVVLTAPGAISDETAARLKTQWEKNFGGENYGRTAVLGDGLKPETFTVTAEDSQLIEQLKWTGDDVCRAFGVPAYKVGIGPMPAYNNIEGLERAYYSQTLQELIECIELLLDEGLDLPTNYGTEFDLNQLLRMDTATRYKAHSESLKAGWKSPNEVRAEEDLGPVLGGEEPLIQQQNWPLSVLARRGPPDQSKQPEASPPNGGDSALLENQRELDENIALDRELREAVGI